MSTGINPANHPELPAGMNSTPVACDEFNGIGINEIVYVDQWDSAFVPRPTILTPADNDGQTVDMRVAKERRRILIHKDRNKTRAAGFRGVTQ